MHFKQIGRTRSVALQVPDHASAYGYSTMSQPNSHINETNSPPRAVSKDEDYGDKVVENESRETLDVRAEDQRHDVEKATEAPMERERTSHSVNNVASIPNGGIRAWMQVAGSFFLFYNTWFVASYVEIRSNG